MTWKSDYFQKAEKDHEQNMLDMGYIKITPSIRHLFGYHKYLSSSQAKDLKTLLEVIDNA